jgi:hypothetical protein
MKGSREAYADFDAAYSIGRVAFCSGGLYQVRIESEHFKNRLSHMPIETDRFEDKARHENLMP